MLSTITIFNFQAHKSLEVELDQVTTFVGPNGKGKSSVFRALRWLMLNKAPKGRFIKYGEETASVSGEFENIKLKRKKGKETNSYFLNKNQFKAIGNNVPENIAQLLNVGEENFQRQFEPYFWFHDSPGQLSKNLNRIIDLDVIDRTMTEIKSQVRKLSLAKEINEENLDKARREKRRLRPALKLQRKLAKIDLLAKSGDQKRAKVGSIQSGVARIEIMRSRENSLKSKIDALERIDFENIEKLSNEINSTKKQIEEIRSLLENIEDLETEICAKEKSLVLTEKKLAKLTKGKNCPLCGNMMSD